MERIYISLDLNSQPLLLYGQCPICKNGQVVHSICQEESKCHSGKFKVNGHEPVLVIRWVKHRGCLPLHTTPTLVPAPAFLAQINGATAFQANLFTVLTHQALVSIEEQFQMRRNHQMLFIGSQECGLQRLQLNLNQLDPNSIKWIIFSVLDSDRWPLTIPLFASIYFRCFRMIFSGKG